MAKDTLTLRRSLVHEGPVDKFQSQQLVDFRRIVAATFRMPIDDGFDRPALEVWPGKALRVKQHFLNVPREPVSVPDAEMAKLMPAQKQAFQMERGECMIDPGHP